MDMDRHKCCICSETWVSSFKIVQNLIQLVIGEEYEKGQKNIVWFQKGKLEDSNKISSEMLNCSFSLKGFIRLKKYVWKLLP